MPDSPKNLLEWMNEMAGWTRDEVASVLSDPDAPMCKMAAARLRLNSYRLPKLDESSNGGIVEHLVGADGKMRKYVRLEDANRLLAEYQRTIERIKLRLHYPQ